MRTGDSPYYIQESLNPNYWGQLATRSPARQAYNVGVLRSGSCVRTGNGLTSAAPAHRACSSKKTVSPRLRDADPR